MLKLGRDQLAQIFSHARRDNPCECCGLIGGVPDGRVLSIYPLRNVAQNPEFAYEAAPEELFTAQRQLRERGEELLGIYHSHPRAREPLPSDTDVRLAYYPTATYLIVGLGDGQPKLGAFHISEKEHSWVRVEYAIADE